MQLILDKNHKDTLFEQARHQLLSALHTGKLRPGDRLPSVRQVALRNSINIKTAFSIYQRLKDELYVQLRPGSGAYVSDRERVDVDQADCLAIFRLIKSNLSQAEYLNLDRRQYAELVRDFVERRPGDARQLTVIECNEEQINSFALEISGRLSVRVNPLLLSDLERADERSVGIIEQTDYFVTTDYHFKRVKELVAEYQKRILQLRLNPTFVPGLLSAASRGRVLMIVSDTNFFPAFQDSLRALRIRSAVLNNITALDHRDLARVRSAVSRIQFVYVSPICDPAVHRLIPDRVQELRFDSLLSAESIETLEAVLLFDGWSSNQPAEA